MAVPPGSQHATRDLRPAALAPRLRVLGTAKDGGAYWLLKTLDGLMAIRGWGLNGWLDGGASLDEFILAPPVSSAFAAKLGIPASDLVESERRK
jgi:hypothetical protein